MLFAAILSNLALVSASGSADFSDCVRRSSQEFYFGTQQTFRCEPLSDAQDYTTVFVSFQSPENFVPEAVIGRVNERRRVINRLRGLLGNNTRSGAVKLKLELQYDGPAGTNTVPFAIIDLGSFRFDRSNGRVTFESNSDSANTVVGYRFRTDVNSIRLLANVIITNENTANSNIVSIGEDIYNVSQSFGYSPIGDISSLAGGLRDIESLITNTIADSNSIRHDTVAALSFIDGGQDTLQIEFSMLHSADSQLVRPGQITVQLRRGFTALNLSNAENILQLGGDRIVRLNMSNSAEWQLQNDIGNSRISGKHVDNYFRDALNLPASNINMMDYINNDELSQFNLGCTAFWRALENAELGLTSIDQGLIFWNYVVRNMTAGDQRLNSECIQNRIPQMQEQGIPISFINIPPGLIDVFNEAREAQSNAIAAESRALSLQTEINRLINAFGVGVQDAMIEIFEWSHSEIYSQPINEDAPYLGRRIRRDEPYNGDIYEGQFVSVGGRHHAHNGHGVYVYAENEARSAEGIHYGRRYYHGAFENYRFEGYGVLTMLNGDSYEGMFSGSVMNGYGVINSAGVVYYGQVSNGNKHGLGVEVGPDNRVLRAGRWRGGEFAG